MESDETLLDRAPGYLSETQRAITLSSNLIGAGAHLPNLIDFASVLMRDHGLWYLQNVCPAFDITEIGDLSLPSQWIFACLVRTVSPCYQSVCRQLQGFPVSALHFYISTERLAQHINSSPESLRHRFLLSLSVGGSASMLEPLLFQGLSLGDLSTYYLKKAIERGRFDMACLLCNYGAFLSQENSIWLLERMKPDFKTLLLDPRKSQAFCDVLERALKSCGPLQELGDEHAIFEILVRIYQRALLQSKMQHIDRMKSDRDSYICNKVVELLLEAGLFRNSKLPTRYWSWDLRSLTNENIDESPLTLAIYVRNLHAIRLLIMNGYDVNEFHHHFNGLCHCMEYKGTPLIYAIWLGFAEGVNILLEAGASVTKMGAQGQTAPEMAKVCLSRPIAKDLFSSAKDTVLEDCENYIECRQRILAMVCAGLKTKHSMSLEEFLDTLDYSLLQFAGRLIACFVLARSQLITCRSPSTAPSLLDRKTDMCILSKVSVRFKLRIRLGSVLALYSELSLPRSLLSLRKYSFAAS